MKAELTEFPKKWKLQLERSEDNSEVFAYLRERYGELDSYMTHSCALSDCLYSEKLPAIGDPKYIQHLGHDTSFTQISYEQFKQFRMKEKQKTSLPEKWYVQIPETDEDVRWYLEAKYGKVDSWFKGEFNYCLLSEEYSGFYTPSYATHALGAVERNFTEISLEQFKQLVKSMKEKSELSKPTSYIVRCGTRGETNDVISTFYKNQEGSNRSHWNYVLCDPARKEDFNVNCVEDDRPRRWTGIPSYSYKQWKEMMSKPVTEAPKVVKKEPVSSIPISTASTSEKLLPTSFIIHGSESLLQTMWKELLALGYTPSSFTPKNPGNVNAHNSMYVSTNFIRVSDDIEKSSFSRIYYGDVHSDDSDFGKSFQLPQQWNEALAFAKEQLSDKIWKPQPTFVKGQWLVGSPLSRSQHICLFRFNGIGGNNRVDTSEYYHMPNADSSLYEGKGSNFIVVKDCRIATNTEIQASLRTVAIKKGYGADGDYKYDPIADTLAHNGTVIYRSGNWRVVLPFGNLMFYIYKDEGFASCSHGDISKKQIDTLVNTIRTTKFLGYGLTIDGTLDFGCCHGTLTQAIAIQQALS